MDDEQRTADEIAEFWREASSALGAERVPAVTGLHTVSPEPPPAWSFGDDPEMADTLLQLVLSGRKTATASSYWEYEAAGQALPQVGDLSLVLDGQGHPRAVLRTEQVRIVPFDEVDDDHARAEGEGDGSAEYWRAVHRTFFRRNAGATNPFSETMPVVLERFRVVHPA